MKKSSAKTAPAVTIDEKPPKRRLPKLKLHKSMIIIFTTCLVLLTSVGVSGYFYFQYQKTQALLKNSPQAAQAEVASLIAKVNELTILPTGEEPTVATVSDITKLQDQPFFQKAQNGDKVLIYRDARKAVLYRPGIHKIVEIGPVNIDGTQQIAGANTQDTASNSAEVQSRIAQVVLYNGTTIVGLTGTAAAKLQSVDNIEITARENAAKQDYIKTQVLSLSSEFNAKGAEMAKVLGGEVISALPEGETKPDADILVIVAK